MFWIHHPVIQTPLLNHSKTFSFLRERGLTHARESTFYETTSYSINNTISLPLILQICHLPLYSLMIKKFICCSPDEQQTPLDKLLSFWSLPAAWHLACISLVFKKAWTPRSHSSAPEHSAFWRVMPFWKHSLPSVQLGKDRQLDLL